MMGTHFIENGDARRLGKQQPGEFHNNHVCYKVSV
jgi:hypothetical protein